MSQQAKAKTIPVCLTEGMLESEHTAPVVLSNTKWQLSASPYRHIIATTHWIGTWL